VWGTILQQLPNARLALKWRTFDLPEVRARVLDILRPLGISDERIEWWGYLPGQVQHLEFYNSIDIALDTYPYNGTTTICDALSMGVPVVSQYGATHVSRTSLSLLSRLGLTQYAVPDEAGYVAQALAIARDLTSLANLRLGLRGVLESSPLCAYDDFVQSLEETFIAIAHRATND
jgi:predicted O-linked N-acetylglucosamine transferase (SPINDLY family)